VNMLNEELMDLLTPPPGSVFSSALRPLEEIYRRGDRDISVKGFLLRDSSLRPVERVLYPYLLPRVGRYEFRVLAPSPRHGVWIPVLLTEATKTEGRGALVEVEGRIYRFPPQVEDYRFYIRAERVKALRMDDILDPPPIRGKHIVSMVESATPVERPETLAMALVGSGAYLGRNAGIALGAFTTDAGGYPSAGDLRRYIKSVNSIFPRPVTSGRAVLRIRGRTYSVGTRTTIRLRSEAWDRACEYLWDRKGRCETEVTSYGTLGRREIMHALEESASPGRTARLNMTLSDIPLIPVKEEIQVDGRFISEYEFDILSYTIHASTKYPDAGPYMDEVERAQREVFRIIDTRYPELKEMAVAGFILDLGLMRGIGEGVARMRMALMRLEISPSSLERVVDFFFERISDAFSGEIRFFEKTRLPDVYREERMKRILYEMTAMRPSGWTEEDFGERMAMLFGYDARKCERILKELVEKGEVIRRTDPYTGRYLYRVP